MTDLEKALINAQVILSKGKIQGCPTCKRLIEKNDGCDHMHCAYCDRDFQWHHSRIGRLPPLPYPEISRTIQQSAEQQLATQTLGSILNNLLHRNQDQTQDQPHRTHHRVRHRVRRERIR